MRYQLDKTTTTGIPVIDRQHKELLDRLNKLLDALFEGKGKDVMMPQMDGYELVRELRSHLETASLPIVMLTTKSDKKSEIKGLDAGADDYMAKPFDKERLVVRVEMLLKLRG